jgi:hypothetical protein
MIPFALLKLIPLKVWLILIAVVAVGIWYWRATDAAYERGKTEVIQEIRQSNDKAKEQADGAARTVENCDGRWDRARGVCVSDDDAR